MFYFCKIGPIDSHELAGVRTTGKNKRIHRLCCGGLLVVMSDQKLRPTRNARMGNALKRGIVLITGWIFISLGIAGLVLPLLQGVLFLLVGLSILSSEDVWAQSLIRK